MHGPNQDFMLEKDFETAPEERVSPLSPGGAAEEVTPWRKAMTRVLIGMALCTITLNVFCLNYILPTVGIMLSLLGFRALRQENKWFRNCFILICIRIAYVIPTLILNTTIIQSAFYQSPAARVLTIINLLITFAEFICFRQGLRAAQEKSGLPPKNGAAAALIVWYALMCVLALIRYNGLLLTAVMLIWYLYLVYRIYQCTKELEEAGYAIQAVPVRIPDGWLVLLLLAVLIAGGTFGYLFGDHYPMAWSVAQSAEQAETEAIRRHLTELGFPDYVLKDLTAEDLAACSGALQVVVDTTDAPVNDGKPVFTKERNGSYSARTVYDVKELRLTSVAVQVPGERETWILFHHFLWTVDPGFYGTECLQIWPAYRFFPSGWLSAGDVTGRILYDNGGDTFAAPYYFLGEKTVTSSSFFYGEQQNTDLYAAFSMPKEGENHRGYLAYPIELAQDGFLLSSQLNYTHQRSWLQYPAMTAMEKRIATSSDRAGEFRTVQGGLQFFVAEDGTVSLS